METSNNDVVITGLAAISAAGMGTDPLLAAVRRGESLLQPVPEEVVGAGHFWGKAEAFRAADFIAPLKARKFDLSSLLAAVAAGMALKDAGIDAASFDAARIGLVLGCGFGGISNAEGFLRGYLSAGAEGLLAMLDSEPSPGNPSLKQQLKGPNVTVIERLCSAEAAFFMAHRFLQEERADIILTGGVDELFPAHLRRLKGSGLLRSFGSGFGEGAGILVLEKGDRARRRNAPVRAAVGRMTTIGRFYPEPVEGAVERLLPEPFSAGLVSLSGTATSDKWLLSRLPDTPRIDISPVVGRSPAMGGLVLTTLILMLAPGGGGLHLASSPEGPYYAIDFKKGAI